MIKIRLLVHFLVLDHIGITSQPMLFVPIARVNTQVIYYLKISTIGETHLNCNFIEGSIVDGIRQPMLFSFILDEPSG